MKAGLNRPTIKINGKWTCTPMALSQSTDRSMRFTTLATFTHSHTGWWWLPCKGPTAHQEQFLAQGHLGTQLGEPPEAPQIFSCLMENIHTPQDFKITAHQTVQIRLSHQRERCAKSGNPVNKMEISMADVDVLQRENKKIFKKKQLKSLG